MAPDIQTETIATNEAVETLLNQPNFSEIIGSLENMFSKLSPEQIKNFLGKFNDVLGGELERMGYNWKQIKTDILDGKQ